MQDTTTFNYNSHYATLNLGPIGRFKKGKTQGIYCHTAMVYTIHGTPLGIIFQKFWTRRVRAKAYQARRESRHKLIPISTKENFRWAQGVEAAYHAQQETQRRIIVVGDNESDINDVIRLALERKTGFVIRTDHARACIE